MHVAKIAKWVALILFISLLANVFVYALMNADLTQTRVFLDNWPVFAVALLCGAIAAFLGRKYG